ncbi:LysR family transcriptional regulator [Cephaloticoccus primus]|uniref:LysR family transcriptional regulator n=1 Tax=Cephaloticoccus primus TaxID=1548207 RepID=A0A139SMX1_9BACT|nr:LysR family transcriptional regulator [Cephaloticoccus primus]KXU35861.1 LysR family transcriptional regulator [Cephaloticoccus primus]
MLLKYQFDYELRQLTGFFAVAQLLHFSRAAEFVGIAQPALSRQIAHLEQALGCELFVRTRRSVELTAAGHALFERLLPLLGTLQRLPAELAAVSAGEVGQVRIGFTGLAMATVLPGIIRAFSQTHPAIRVGLAESPSAAQIDALHSGEIDCGFFHPSQEKPEGIRTRQLLREPNGVLLPAAHPLAQRKRLHLSQLGDTPFVLFPRHMNPGFYDRILSTCEHAGITLKIVDEIWPRANAIGLVRAGLGATFITPSEAKTLPEDILFRPLSGPAPESRLVAGWSTAASPSPAAQAFIQRVARG